jgi:hypothetical protein
MDRRRPFSHSFNKLFEPSMKLNARELVELAALVAEHGPQIIAGKFELSSESLEQYWVASKCRLDRWLRHLQPRPIEPSPPHDGPDRLSAVVEEIFTSEVLTRVWTAVLAARAARHGQHDGEMIARSVMLSHMEARNRALKLLIHGVRVAPEAAVELNRLRRRSERWSDVLVGKLLPASDVAVFAVDGDRAREFALDMHYQSGLISERQVWGLLMASLRAAFQRSLHEPSPNGDLNERIAAGVLGALGPELFDETGQFQSLRRFHWLNQMDERPLDESKLFPSDQLFPKRPKTESPPKLPPSRGLPSEPRF